MTSPKIIIVEDEPIVGMYIKDLLIKSGYSVLTVVSTAKKLFEFLKEDTPDIILMDITLKGNIDGIEAAKTLQKDYNIPVIFLTAHSNSDTVNRAKEAEPYGFLVKPIKEKELPITVDMAIHKHKLFMEKLKSNNVKKKSNSKRREEIINSSIMILYNKGLKQMTIRNIASKLNITEGAIYKHIKSKSEIEQHIIETVKEKSNDIIQKINNDKQKDAVEQLKCLLRTWYEAINKEEYETLILFSDKTQITNEESLLSKINKLKDRIINLTEKLLKDAKEQDLIKNSIDIVNIRMFIHSIMNNYEKNKNTDAEKDFELLFEEIQSIIIQS